MKIIVMTTIMMLMSIFVYADGCELPKLEKTKILEEKKDAGCKIEKTSEDLVTCLLNAKNEEEEKACHANNKKNINEKPFLIEENKEINNEKDKKEEKKKSK